MEIEQNQDDIQRLCWLVEQQRKAEIEYERAKWRLSYYKKSKALPKKLEEMKLNVLDKKKNLLDIKKKLRSKIGIVKNKLKAVLLYCDGIVHGIRYPYGVFIEESKTLDVKQIEAMANEYEAQKALNKILTKGSQ